MKRKIHAPLYLTTYITLVFCCVTLLPIFAIAQTWQRTLEDSFDIVETFDQLQDWTGSGSGNVFSPTGDGMPKKLDGSDSVWLQGENPNISLSRMMQKANLVR